jgi:hypothetical protein
VHQRRLSLVLGGNGTEVTVAGDPSSELRHSVHSTRHEFVQVREGVLPKHGQDVAKGTLVGVRVTLRLRNGYMGEHAITPLPRDGDEISGLAAWTDDALKCREILEHVLSLLPRHVLERCMLHRTRRQARGDALLLCIRLPDRIQHRLLRFSHVR